MLASCSSAPSVSRLVSYARAQFRRQEQSASVWVSCTSMMPLGCKSSKKRLRKRAYAMRLLLVDTTVWLQRVCLMALSRDVALPSGVFGPVERRAFSQLIAARSVGGWSVVHILA